MQLLLVEDDPAQAERALYALRDETGTVDIEHAADGREALGYLADAGYRGGRPLPDLVLLDLDLPEVNGLQFLQRVRSRPELAAMPVVVFSNCTSPAKVEAAYAARANSYLIKPVEYDAFARALRAAVAYWGELNRLPGRPGDGCGT